MYGPMLALLVLAAVVALAAPFLLWVLLFAAIVFLPLYLTVQSAMALVLVPQQLLGMLTDRRLRRNHALEHATVNVIEEHLGPTNISGVATSDGFVLMGDVPSPRHLIAAAQSALTRLRRGESQLALHPRCGTSLAAANLLFAVVFLGGLLAAGMFDWLHALLALAAAYLLGRPVGTLLQKWVTTDANVGDVGLVDVAVEAAPMRFAFGPVPAVPRRYYFRTGEGDAAPLRRARFLGVPPQRQFLWSE